ncbi:HprK-related kinase A [Photobacterium sanguinicancri]|uniref:HprK-related kinase A n=1 Tax=Photobacterium sanguinicancri TaxID=875932 RepID=UPI0026E27991|nr:HprK-related kinase A [Photobacterium sanguinicancri]MDO6498010.1 HprK-related kinase A [Photobacterium sanguinicancri]
MPILDRLKKIIPTINKHYTVVTGPFIISISSPVPSVQRYIESHYAHNLIDCNDNTFIDFEIQIGFGKGIRRWFRQQATFTFNHHQPFKPLPLNQANAMLEWGMNWVISSYAHQYLIIHAATLEKDGNGIIISAPSGSGKSTLCAYLAAKGWRLLSDELALINPETLQLHGLGRPMNLKNQSVDLMRNYYPKSAFSPIIQDTHKGKISLVKARSTYTEQLPLVADPKLLVFVNYDPSESCYAERVTQSHALTEIIQNSFNFGLLNQQGFQTAKALVNKTKALFIEYHNFQDCESVIKEHLNERSSIPSQQSGSTASSECAHIT